MISFQFTNKALAEKIRLIAYLDVLTYMQIINFNVKEVAIVVGTCVQIWLNKEY